jgi:hypothetical protein
MTIQFNCPGCNELIAFADKYGGKRAHCATCGQRFVIPLDSSEAPKKVKPPKAVAEPLPGFYEAVFIGSGKLFTTPQNITGLVFIITAVCFKFFVAGMNYTLTIPGQWLTFDFPLPIGWILNAAAWGFLFWYYMEVVYSTAFDKDELPEVIVGGMSGFFWRIVKSMYMLVIILLVVELPFIVAATISRKTGGNWPVLLRALMLGGLFFFPMAILTAAVGKDLTMLRPDYFVISICRAFGPYLVTVGLFGAAAILQLRTSQYAGQDAVIAAGLLLLNVAVQALVLIAMRSIGLFYRHYSCHLTW